MPFGAALILECCVQANGDSGAGKKQLPAALRARLAARGIIKVCTHPTPSNQEDCILNATANSVTFSRLFALSSTVTLVPTSPTMHLNRARSAPKGASTTKNLVELGSNPLLGCPTVLIV